MTDEPNPTTPAPDADQTTAQSQTGRSRGRPTIAELEAREQALKQREEEIAMREREAALLLAEANADMRAVDLDRKLSASKPAPVSPARSGSFRSDDVRTDTVTGELRRRRYHSGEMPNEFFIPDSDIPPGTSYQWNNYQVFGQNNPSYDSHMLMQGWRPVPAERHPNLVPKDHTGPIIVKGQILMERPVELTQEALQEDYDRAVGEVRLKEEQLYGTPAGTLPRARKDGSNDFISVSKEVVRGTPTKPNYQYESGGLPIE